MSLADTNRLADYLDHALGAVARIKRYLAGRTEPDFLGDEMVQDAVVRNLEILGEALHNVETRFPEFAALHPEIPWSSAYGMRNALSHGYFKVDLKLVWRTTQRDLPALASQLQALRGPL